MFTEGACSATSTCMINCTVIRARSKGGAWREGQKKCLPNHTCWNVLLLSFFIRSMINCTVIRARSKGGAYREGPKNVCQTIHVGMSCCCHFSYVPWLTARSSEREVRVGPTEKGQKMFAKPYMLECLAAVMFHTFQVWKCFTAAECLHVAGLEGSQTWTMPHPDQQGWSYNGDHQLTFLFVFISQQYSRFGVQLSHLAFFWDQHFPPV